MTDHYKEQADLLNAIMINGRPMFKVSPEYMLMNDERNGGLGFRNLEDMIGNNKMSSIDDIDKSETSVIQTSYHSTLFTLSYNH